MFFASDLQAKEYTFIAEITPPYTYFDDKQISGIYKDFLDNAFATSEHSYVFKGFNTRRLITAVGNTEFDAVIGVSSYAPYYRVFKTRIPIGSTSLHPIALDGMLDEPYTESLSAKREGAVYGLGFDMLLPNIDLLAYRYAEQGVVELFNHKIEIIIEDPLIILCTSELIHGLIPANSQLYGHSLPLKVVDLYIGLYEPEHPLTELLTNSAELADITRLSVKYFRSCGADSDLIINR